MPSGPQSQSALSSTMARCDSSRWRRLKFRLTTKNIRDKAMALQAYYRQARNLDAEREAANVRLRAERRSGELLKELARTTPQTANPSGLKREPMSPDATRVEPSPYAAALEANRMSRQTAHRFQALADVPAETFERPRYPLLPAWRREEAGDGVASGLPTLSQLGTGAGRGRKRPRMQSSVRTAICTWLFFLKALPA